MKKVEENNELPSDVLDIIFKTLDFDDHFQFADVCKNWRTFHESCWRNFLASQEPLLLQISYHDWESYSFISVPDQKVHHLKMMKYFPPSTYVTFSSGYFIMVGYYVNSFMLINPFTRIKKVINGPTCENSLFLTTRALLAFGKCSEEFVLVVLCKRRLHVYQSQNCDWVTYSTMGNSGRVVDFVVLHNIIYVITNMAYIGVINLNSANVKFLKLKSTPNVNFSSCLKLVNCNEQLLVVDFMPKEIRNVYKIDFSTMNYVKLETLGDIALFCGSNGLKRNCYALSNPNKWGYESNSVYVISLLSTICSVYSGDDKQLQKCITLPAPDATRCLMVDWCFRHLQYEVDYSLVE
ncbi:putative F-box domain-containing protein [Medicago truncatula]|uniref:F-box protein n=1 Tax=Medicago truncatula TaxID=3880 RepID=A0A072UV92_MEDTR|nr:uncharacterized protein LOC25488899 [Medicago truncatula]XP_024634341.1 uncharacterized protein LOC25488899 [Medicago truncatula]KEH33542.1 F-box protein [Medicago truncatula]RHN66675.1 putative F-box domain-containing protein [Medicago truncatula]